mmetsp:Transcript_22557/g.30888  ORF Transcript_22557/g.30888 Transcript_22557/m.30888 type:complete len:124 (-) Transcript_22557:3499-3870(-)
MTNDGDALLRLLANAGCRCFEAADGVECVQRMAAEVLDGEEVVDLVLMDFVMAEMNGPEATQILRRQGFRGLVVGVTGNVLQADVDLFLSSGADAVLPKPLVMGRLRDLLRGFHCVKLGHTLL